MSSVAAPLPTKTSTRVLTLHPGAGADPISTSLDVIDLAHKFSTYEAISYTWGSLRLDNTTSVDGCEVDVTANLHRCLWRLRSSTAPRRLWCDYLCITQSDLGEKAQQVQIIGSIFSCATIVLIWLGEHADGSEHLFHDWAEPRKPLRCWPFRSSAYKSWEAAYRVAATERAWQWLHFWQRSYWRRTWIIQELKLAKRIIVHVGCNAMDWSELISARFSAVGMYGGFDRLPTRGTAHRKSDLDEPLLVLSAHLSWQNRIVHVPFSSWYPEIRQALHSYVPFWHKEPRRPSVFTLRRRPGPKSRLTAGWHQELSRSSRSDIKRLDRRENDANSIFHLLNMFKHSFCYDPRDKVYALQPLEALSKSAEAELGIKPLTVDYERTVPKLLLSVLEDRFINLPPESNFRSGYRKLLLRMGFNDKTVDVILRWTTEDPWPQRPPHNLGSLLDTLDFDYEHCRKVADLALEKSRIADQPYARRWQQVSETIFVEFEMVSSERNFWKIVKRRWDAGEVVVLGRLKTWSLTPNENMYWHLIGEHLTQQS